METPRLLQAGLNSVGHWFDSRSMKINLPTIKSKGLKESAIFEWHKASKAIRIAGIRVSREEKLTIYDGLPPFNPYFQTEKGTVEFSDISQKRILQEVARAVEYIPNGTQLKIKEELDLDEDSFAIAFKNFRKDNPCTHRQDIQFRILSGIAYYNKAYHRLGHKNSAKCTFCPEKEQDFIHLYIKCPEVKRFRSRLSENWPGEKMDVKRWFLGASITDDILEKSKNIIAKEANHYIFKMNWANKDLSFDAFKNWLKSDEEPEEALAMRINKVFDHHLKWSQIQLLLN